MSRRSNRPDLIAPGVDLPRRIDETLEVRRACAEDLAPIMALLCQLHDQRPQPASEESVRFAFAEILASPTRAPLVAVRTPAIVATLDLFVIANLTRGGRPWAGIENFVVDEGCRRQGIGSALLNVAIDLAREAGCYKVQLISHERRGEAHALYAASEFSAPVRGYRRYLEL